MANQKAKKQFSAWDQLRGNIPWEAVIELLGEVKVARQVNEILLPLASHTLELQSLTTRAHKPGFRAELRPTIDKAVQVARSALTDLATHDVAMAKRRMHELDSALQAVRDSLDT